MRRLALVLLLLAACREEAVVVPAPVALTEDALSHFCMMQVTEHGGPKAQVHLRGREEPIFFSQVRDGLAYVKGPERPAETAAFYVSDMARAKSWKSPGADNWIAAEDAHFVVGADVTGGMGAPEIAPFGTVAAARDFAARRGGTVKDFDQIPASAVLGEVEIALPGGDRP